MKPAPSTNPFAALLKQTDLLFTFGLFGVVLLLVVPIPTFLLDLLLAVSIGLSLLILLIVIYIKNPPEFSVFPTLLLSVTLFRLGLNVASTRLILLDGFAGHIIESFGEFVVRGNYVVGCVLFTILVVINFMVITKGAGRIAEVAARFTLDAMPGKQMAIDAELNAGIIDEKTARDRRTNIQREADFYGAMDGASKFVRGDAVAGILITIINVVGGISIGMLQRGMDAATALQRFSILSIGDGIVSQIPALIISVAAGILTTRTAGSSNLGVFVGRQLVIYPRAIAVAGIMLGLFAIIPGLPFMPFAMLATVCGFVFFALRKAGINQEQDEEFVVPPGTAALPPPRASAETRPGSPGATSLPSNPQEEMRQLVRVDTLTIELGYGLLTLADARHNGDLLERITGVRRGCASQLGLLFPSAAIRDNMELDNNQYRFLVRDKPVAQGTIHPNRWLAMNVSGSNVSIKGIPTTEPVFGLEALWIAEEDRKTAEINGYTVVDAPSVLITHLSETLKDVAPMLLEREDVQRLIDMVKERNPTLVAELLPDLVTIGIIQRVLQNLLSEKIPVKNLSLILEAIADFAPYTKNPDELTEQVRKRLGVYFSQQFESEPGKIKALTLDPLLEHSLLTRVRKNQFEVGLAMDPALTNHLIQEISPRALRMTEEGLPPAIILTAELRLAFRRFFEPTFPRLAVLAYQEIPGQTRVESAGLITAPRHLAAPQPAPVAAAASPAESAA